MLNVLVSITNILVIFLLAYCCWMLAYVFYDVFKHHKSDKNFVIVPNEEADKKIKELMLWYECDKAEALCNAVLLAHYCEEKRQQGYEMKVISKKGEEIIEFPLN